MPTRWRVAVRNTAHICPYSTCKNLDWNWLLGSVGARLKPPSARPSASNGTPSFASDQRILATWNAAKASFQRVAWWADPNRLSCTSSWTSFCGHMVTALLYLIGRWDGRSLVKHSKFWILDGPKHCCSWHVYITIYMLQWATIMVYHLFKEMIYNANSYWVYSGRPSVVLWLRGWQARKYCCVELHCNIMSLESLHRWWGRMICLQEMAASGLPTIPTFIHLWDVIHLIDIH